ncbi:MAG: hypothetical protein RLZZ516_2446 [Cyanobacteriota bacterium]
MTVLTAMPRLIRQLCQGAAPALTAAALAVAALPLSARALPGNPRAVSAVVDNKPTNAYLAALSIAAAEEITAGKRYAVSKQDAASLRFAPVSLARYYQLLQPLLQRNPKDLGVIAPDPAQINTAEKLLIAQKVPAATARQVAALQPMVFCPEPGLLVSFNEGPEKGKPFVPCSTDASVVEGMMQRGIKESEQLAKANLHLVAIPLNNFVSYLREEPSERVGQLRVLSSGRMVELVQQLNKQAQTGTTPAR